MCTPRNNKFIPTTSDYKTSFTSDYKTSFDDNSHNRYGNNYDSYNRKDNNTSKRYIYNKENIFVEKKEKLDLVNLIAKALKESPIPRRRGKLRVTGNSVDYGPPMSNDHVDAVEGFGDPLA